MKYLKISNQVEIENNAFHLIGACTKRSDSTKIGYFGSGLKYAIAVLLRENIGFAVYSGKRKIPITYKPDTLRNQEFNVIYIDGQKTSMTTSMGPKWTFWQAIREIYCNALDEPGCKIEQIEDFNPVAGETAFYFCLHDNDLLTDLLNKWDKYFAHKRPPVIDCEISKVYFPYEGKISIYRKDIRCFKSPYSGLYDYNFNTLSINESRMADAYSVTCAVLATWKRYATQPMIKKLMNVYNQRMASEDRNNLLGDLYECCMDWSYGTVYEFNETWLKYFTDKLLVPFESSGWFQEAVGQPNAILVPRQLIRLLQNCFGEKIKTCFLDYDPNANYAIIEPNKRQKYLLKECLSFLEEIKINITYPVCVGKFNDPHTLGCAHKESIVVSQRTFDLGKKNIVNLIVEEQMHLETEYGDKTREFQNYLINEMTTMLENQYGVFL